VSVKRDSCDLEDRLYQMILHICKNSTVIPASYQHDSNANREIDTTGYSLSTPKEYNTVYGCNTDSIGNRQLESLYKPHQIIATDLYDFAYNESDRLFLGKIANQRGQLTVWESQRFNQICNALGVSHE